MGISVATYAMRNNIKNPQIGVNGCADFLQKHEIKLVELNNMFTKPELLPEFAKPFVDRSIKPILLTIDGNNFFQKTEANRQKQMEFMKPWMDAAHNLGIKMVRANMGHNIGSIFSKTDKLENLLATFKPILAYAETLGIKFTFENHGGKSSDVDFQLQVKSALPSPNFGYLLDTGNYKPKNLIYENILKLKQNIFIIHAKTYNFDAQGNETTLDFKKITDNLKSVGYKGDYSIEFEGPLPDFEGVEKTIALLRRFL